MTDCLLIGHNDGDFTNYVKLVRSMGTGTALWRRLALAFVEIDGVPHRSMDIINFSNGRDGNHKPKLSNLDFLWPAVSHLGSYLAQRGFSFDYVNRFQEEKVSLASTLERENVLTVAVTTTLYVGKWWIEEVIGFIRQHNHSARIILGGPYIWNQAAALPAADLDRFCKSLGADIYVISQEGEFALASVIDALKRGGSLGAIDNIAYTADGQYVRTNTSVESNPLAENLVDYSCFDADRVGDCITVRTSKSCPFACSFCSYPQQGGAYVYADVAAVEAQLDRIRRIGSVTAITFVDDTFNVPKGRFKEILRMMIRNGYGFRWNSFLRADHVDAECVDLMQQSGCEGVFLGTESGSDRILKTMNKTARAEHYRRLIPQLRDAGIMTHCSFIVGFPGETHDTVQESVDLIEDARPDTFRTQVWYCDPATPIWNRRNEFGLKGRAFDWEHDTMDCGSATDIVDDLFLRVKNSTWLPQHGFESWSLFYLQRKGMPRDQMMRFVEDFNEAVRFKVRSGNGSLEPRLLDAMLASSRF